MNERDTVNVKPQTITTTRKTRAGTTRFTNSVIRLTCPRCGVSMDLEGGEDPSKLDRTLFDCQNCDAQLRVSHDGA